MIQILIKKLIYFLKLKLKKQKLNNTFKINIIKQLLNPENYYKILPLKSLTPSQKFIKGLVGHFLLTRMMYKIKNPKLLALLTIILGFLRRKNILLKSKLLLCEFAFSTFYLIYQINPQILFISQNRMKWIIHTILSNLPIFISILYSLVTVYKFNNNSSSISSELITVLIRVLGIVYFGEAVRNLNTINFTNSVSQKIIENQFEYFLFPFGESENTFQRYQNLYNQNNSEFKNLSLNFNDQSQVDLTNFEVETLDGKYKIFKQSNGQKILKWIQSKDVKKLSKSTYIPLSNRTKTWFQFLTEPLDKFEINDIVEQIGKKS